MINEIVCATGEPLSKKCEHHIRNLMEWINLPATFIESARYNNPEDSMTKSLQSMMTMSSENIMKEQLDFTNACAEATTLTEADYAMITPTTHQNELKQNPELETALKELLTSTKTMLDFYLQWKASYRVSNYFMIAVRLMQDRDSICKEFGII
ncbi:hypothetical protein K501DRAFT_273792 [Backusella circina FSU 941]|nr:hypothetical protein K501DRAFT_273792 [Backusella circina FSU 941]